MPPLTRAEVFCWVARLLSVEADAQPHHADGNARARELEDGGNMFHDAAVALDGDDGLWQRAMAKWNGGE